MEVLARYCSIPGYYKLCCESCSRKEASPTNALNFQELKALPTQNTMKSTDAAAQTSTEATLLQSPADVREPPLPPETPLPRGDASGGTSPEHSQNSTLSPDAARSRRDDLGSERDSGHRTLSARKWAFFWMNLQRFCCDIFLFFVMSVNSDQARWLPHKKNTNYRVRFVCCICTTFLKHNMSGIRRCHNKVL